jgi:hypothetical protein
LPRTSWLSKVRRRKQHQLGQGLGVTKLCAVCQKPVENPIRNVDGKLVCQPSTLYFRIRDAADGPLDHHEPYVAAMIEHRLLVKRITPSDPREPSQSVTPKAS